MQKYQILFVLACLLAGTALTQKTVSLFCYSCGTTCSGGYCFNVTGDGISELLCPPSNYTCPGNSTVSVTVSKCATDFEGSTCGSKMCYTLPNR